MENTITAIELLQNDKPTLTQLIKANMPIGTSDQAAEMAVLREINNVDMIFYMRPELASCDQRSVLLAVKQSIADNLTLSPNAGLVYLYPGKVRVGTDGANKPIYREVLVYDPTAEGEISIARQAGTLFDFKRPECTFDELGKVETVSFEFQVPSGGGQLRWEKVTFGKMHFERWQQKSAAKFGGNANANYTSWRGGIDPEFAGSKAIKHALKKRGTNKNEYQQQAQTKQQSSATPIETVYDKMPTSIGEIYSYEEVKIEQPTIATNLQPVTTGLTIELDANKM